MESEPVYNHTYAYTYSYFDRWFKTELALFMLFVPALISLWVVTGCYYYYTGTLSLPLIKSTVYFSMTFVFTVIFYGNVRAASKAKSVIIDGNNIVKKSAAGIRAVNCAGVTDIRISKFPLVSEWMVLEVARKKFKIPLYIRNGHEMVEKIFANFETNGLFFKNIATLKHASYSASKRANILHDLRVKHLPNLFRAITFAALLNATVALIYWERSLSTAIFWGIVNMPFQAAAYFFTERVQVKNMISGQTDPSFSKYYIMAALIALFVGMIFGIIYTEPA